MLGRRWVVRGVVGVMVVVVFVIGVVLVLVVVVVVVLVVGSVERNCSAEAHDGFGDVVE